MLIIVGNIVLAILSGFLIPYGYEVWDNCKSKKIVKKRKYTNKTV
ncbi:hypothetical protein [Psychrobacillus sp. FSL H8-0487]